MKANILTFKAMLVAASWAEPNLPTMRMKAENAAMSKKKWIPFGSPYLISRRNKSLSNFQPEIVLYLALLFHMKVIRSSRDRLKIWDITVDNPAPEIPISGKPKFPNINR